MAPWNEFGEVQAGVAHQAKELRGVGGIERADREVVEVHDLQAQPIGTAPDELVARLRARTEEVGEKVVRPRPRRVRRREGGPVRLAEHQRRIDRHWHGPPGQVVHDRGGRILAHGDMREIAQALAVEGAVLFGNLRDPDARREGDPLPLPGEGEEVDFGELPELGIPDLIAADDEVVVHRVEIAGGRVAIDREVGLVDMGAAEGAAACVLLGAKAQGRDALPLGAPPEDPAREPPAEPPNQRARADRRRARLGRGARSV